MRVKRNTKRDEYGHTSGAETATGAGADADTSKTETAATGEVWALKGDKSEDMLEELP